MNTTLNSRNNFINPKMKGKKNGWIYSNGEEKVRLWFFIDKPTKCVSKTVSLTLAKSGRLDSQAAPLQV